MSRSYLVTSIITVLYILNVIQAATSWLQQNSVDKTFLWTITLNDISLMLSSALSDLLLVRISPARTTRSSADNLRVDMALLSRMESFTPDNICPSHLSDCRDWYAPSFSASHLKYLPLLFEGVYLALLRYSQGGSTANGEKAANLLGVAALMTFITTLLATSLIVYRIVSMSCGTASAMVINKRPYLRVIEVLIQSAALYAATALIFAIDQLLTAHIADPFSLLPMIEYVGILFSSISVCILRLVICIMNLMSTQGLGSNDHDSSDCHDLKYPSH